MNEWQEKRWGALIRNIKIDDELLKTFMKHGLLDNKQAEEIQASFSGHEQNSKLLECLNLSDKAKFENLRVIISDAQPQVYYRYQAELRSGIPEMKSDVDGHRLTTTLRNSILHGKQTELTSFQRKNDGNISETDLYNQFDSFGNTLVISMSEVELIVDRLFERNKITSMGVKLIKNEEIFFKRSQMVLELLQGCRDDARKTVFEIFKETKQFEIIFLLCSNGFHFENPHSRQIQRDFIFVWENLKPTPDFLQKLRSNGVLTSREHTLISSESNNVKKNEMLLSILSGKSEDNFKKFLDELLKNGQKDMSQSLSRALPLDKTEPTKAHKDDYKQVRDVASMDKIRTMSYGIFVKYDKLPKKAKLQLSYKVVNRKFKFASSDNMVDMAFSYDLLQNTKSFLDAIRLINDSYDCITDLQNMNEVLKSQLQEAESEKVKLVSDKNQLKELEKAMSKYDYDCVKSRDLLGLAEQKLGSLASENKLKKDAFPALLGSTQSNFGQNQLSQFPRRSNITQDPAKRKSVESTPECFNDLSKRLSQKLSCNSFDSSVSNNSINSSSSLDTTDSITSESNGSCTNMNIDQDASKHSGTVSLQQLNYMSDKCNSVADQTRESICDFSDDFVSGVKMNRRNSKIDGPGNTNRFLKELHVLRNNRLYIIEHITPVINKLLDKLQELNCIRIQQRRDIDHLAQDFEKAEELLTILRVANSAGFQNFIRALRYLSLNHIADVLERGGVVVRIKIFNKPSAHLDKLAKQLNGIQYFNGPKVNKVKRFVDRLKENDVTILQSTKSEPNGILTLWMHCLPILGLCYLRSMAENDTLLSTLTKLFKRLLHTGDIMKRAKIVEPVVIDVDHNQFKYTTDDPLDKISKNEIEDILQCSICLKEYTDPRVLPCQHTFCLKCLEQHWNVKNQRRINCPNCRAEADLPSTGVQGLKSNLTAKKLSVIITKQRESTFPKDFSSETKEHFHKKTNDCMDSSSDDDEKLDSI